MRGIPGFQAEASLGRPSGRYRATAGFRAPGAAGSSMRVSPMAQSTSFRRSSELGRPRLECHPQVFTTS